MKAFYSLIIFSILVTSSNLMGEKNLNDASHKIFLNEIQHELKIFRIDYDQKGASIHQSFNNSILLINISSRRNNFEEVIMLSLGVIGKFLANRINEAVITKTRLFIPTVVEVNCNAPFSREEINILTSLDSKILIQFGNGHISAQELWSVAKNSVTSSINVINNDSSPNEFIADIDFENMISTRIALEGKSNPRLSSILSTAMKASWVPGLESKLEKMLVSHLKDNHSDLMAKVMGEKISHEQMLRIGKKFLEHIQKPYDQIQLSHTIDSLKYVWKGNNYPADLDIYYKKYREEHGL